MEHPRTPGEGGAPPFGEEGNRDYICAMSGLMPENAFDQLPWWAWALCAAVLAVLTLVLIRLG